jgi:O-antigen/teichoic acid export membrane protein
VSYYAVPFSLAERLNIFPGSLAQALFPKFAANRDASYAKRLAEDAVLTVSALLAPVTCFGIAVLPCFLAVWINKGFAEHSYFAGQILLVGIWLNGAAIVPLARLQAIGRPDLPLKLYLIEIVPYVLCLWWGLSQFGVAGAALAWTIRAAVDMVLMTRAAKLPAGTIFRLMPNFALTVLTVLVGNLPSSFGHIWAYQTAMAILSGALSWRQLPDQARDAIVGQYFRARRTIKMYSCS